MRFAKPALTVPGQLDLLRQRGLQIRDPDRAEWLLRTTTLFRLTPYMRPFQRPDDPDHRFLDSARLADIVAVYRFDSELRQLVMSAIERFEVAVRAAITNHMAPAHGTHWYMDDNFFGRDYDHGRLLDELRGQAEHEQSKFARERWQISKRRSDPATKQRQIENRKRDNYMRFYAETYTEPELPPSWAVVEEISLGAISRMYQGLRRDRDRKSISTVFRLPQRVLVSWLHTLTFVRNICAHHSRLWNRELAVAPKWPQSLESSLDLPRRRRFFSLAVMLTYLTECIGPDTRWLPKFTDLLDRYPDVPRHPMGLPDDWRERLQALQQQIGVTS